SSATAARSSGSSHSRDFAGIIGSASSIGVAAVLTFLRHRSHHVAGGPVHPAENGEVPFLVEAGRIGPDQEELRAVAARAAVRHGYRALGVGLGAVCLVGELVARATLSGACRVSTLQDE